MTPDLLSRKVTAMRFVVAIVALCCSTSIPAAAAKIAVLAPEADLGVRGADERAAATLADALAAAVSRAGHEVVTQQQITALIGMEAARQLAGCEGQSCAAELGDALGADVLLTARVSRVGRSTIVVVQRIGHDGAGGRVADKRIPAARIEQVLDALPTLVAEVLVGLPATATPASTTGSTTSLPTKPPVPVPPRRATPPAARREVPHADKDPLRRLTVAVDDATGRAVAFDADDPLRGPLFTAARDERRAWNVRVVGGGTSGNGDFEIVFWDPRIQAGWQRSLSRKAGVVTVQCGEVARPLRVLDRRQARRWARQVQAMEAPWQRQLLRAARDDELTWYLVDGARDAKPGQEDLVLWIGRKGEMVAVDAEGARVGDDVVFAGAGVKVRIPNDASAPGGATLHGVTRALSAVDVFAAAPEVYGALRPWGDVPLGTPCDP